MVLEIAYLVALSVMWFASGYLAAKIRDYNVPYRAFLIGYVTALYTNTDMTKEEVNAAMIQEVSFRKSVGLSPTDRK